MDKLRLDLDFSKDPIAQDKFIVEIDEYQQACLNLAECIEKVSSQEAVGLLLMFALGRMGYHL